MLGNPLALDTLQPRTLRLGKCFPGACESEYIGYYLWTLIEQALVHFLEIELTRLDLKLPEAACEQRRVGEDHEEDEVEGEKIPDNGHLEPLGHHWLLLPIDD